MANTFGILSILVLLAASYVGWKNKEVHETTKKAVATQEENKKQNQKSLEKLKNEIAVLVSETNAATEASDIAKGKWEEQVAENKDTEEEIEEVTEDLEETTERVEAADEKMAALGTTKTLAPKIEELSEDIGILEDEVAVLEARVANLKKEREGTEAVLASTSNRLSDIVNNRSYPTMKTTIRSVDHSVGLVTLNAGMKQGVVGGSRVKVMRGGQQIALMTIMGISPNKATAEVDQSSLAEGESVRSGDVVVPANAPVKKGATAAK